MTSAAKVQKKSTGKRRFHKKSRKGCLSCKRRRVKCDESHPLCKNCDRMGIECSWPADMDQEQEQEPTLNAVPKKTIAVVKQEPSVKIETAPVVFSPSQFGSLGSPGALGLAALAQSPLNMDSPFTGLAGLVNAANVSTTPPSIPLPFDGSNTNASAQLNDNPHLQLLSGLPQDQQSKIIQQFSSLPLDKQQQLQQTAMALNITSDTISKLFGGPSADPTGNAPSDPLSGLIGELLPTRVPLKTKGPTPTPMELQNHHLESKTAGPSISPDNIKSSPMPPSNLPSAINGTGPGDAPLNLLDLRLMYHYTTKVWPTITAAGISDSKIWSDDIPMLAFKYPFLMHSVLAFSATHLSRSERGLDQYVTNHRADALRLLREAVLEMSPENTDALVASALILIMDSLANASLPSTSTSVKSLPSSAWIFHVKGAATILTAVWPLSEKSRFYKFISVDLGDLAEIGYDLISGELSHASTANSTDKSIHINPDLTSLADLLAETYSKGGPVKYSSIQCFDPEISDMFPVSLVSPYFPTLAYMAKLYQERRKSDFILRIFAFPALLDKRFLGLLINCDLTAMRIMRCYYTLLRSFTEEMKEKVWFLEGVSTVLPVDVDQYSGGGGMHMMLDFLGGPNTIDDDGQGENYVAKSAEKSGLLDTNNLPSVSMNDDPDANMYYN